MEVWGDEGSDEHRHGADGGYFSGGVDASLEDATVVLQLAEEAQGGEEEGEEVIAREDPAGDGQAHERAKEDRAARLCGV